MRRIQVTPDRFQLGKKTLGVHHQLLKMKLSEEGLDYDPVNGEHPEPTTIVLISICIGNKLDLSDLVSIEKEVTDDINQSG